MIFLCLKDGDGGGGRRRDTRYMWTSYSAGVGMNA